MKIFFIIALAFNICTDAQAKEKVVLDLSDGITWKKVFDAGFRPKYLNGGEYMCTQYNVFLTIKDSDNDINLDLGVGDIDFKVKANHILTHFSFYGRESRNIEDARKKCKIFSEMFGESVTRRAELKTFQIEHKVDYGGRKLEPPEIEEHIDFRTASNAARIGDFSIIYGFSDSYKDDLPLVERLSVSLKSKEAKNSKRLTNKIQPPVGYEHISMEPDLAAGSQRRNLKVADKGFGAIKNLPSTVSQNSGGDVLVEYSSSLEADSQDPQKAENISFSSRYPWLIGVVFLVGISLLIFKKWKRK